MPPEPSRVGSSLKDRQRLAAALHVEDQFPTNQHDQGTCFTSGPMSLSIRPRKRSAVRVGRITGREDDSTGLCRFALMSAHSIDGTRSEQTELHPDLRRSIHADIVRNPRAR